MAEKNKWSRKMRYVRTDAWRGYEQPVYAVAGANDTGESSDSPCRSSVCKMELGMAQKALKEKGIPSRLFSGRSSNVFCMHRYLIAPVNLIEQARAVMSEWYASVVSSTRLLYMCK